MPEFQRRYMPSYIKIALKRLLPKSSTTRWFLGELAKHPLIFPLTFARSWIASWRLTNRPWPIQVRLHHSTNLSILRHPKAIVYLHGVLIFDDWGGVFESSSIAIGENARLVVDGEFRIGPGTHISICTAGQLFIGGTDKEAASGITCRTRIMVEQDVHIGKDCIIAWGCFITDSDWHTIVGRPRCIPVFIDDHVWISHDVSVIKGAIIPYGCIVAPKSVVGAKQFKPHSLLAGQPAGIKRIDVHWHQ